MLGTVPHDPMSVSVIIPCYNARRWIGEAIESCLAQTQPPDEIIVVDDGSNDGSGEVVTAFGDKVRYVRQANAGGCSARNAGFALSTGTFVQFLDADDFLLPTKLQHHCSVLETTGAAAVYGDWRHQFHEPDGRVWLEEPKVSGRPTDVLEALIGGWWVSPAALMFRREIVEAIGGWDEGLPAAQDRDFFQRVAMATDEIVYAPGCEAIYRRYGAVTVSTGNAKRYALSHLQVSEKAETLLTEAERLTPAYKNALAQSYFLLSRNIASFDESRARSVERHARDLDPDFRPSAGAIYLACYRLLGFIGAERVARLKRMLVGARFSPGHVAPDS
ncbi:glycosyltransferase family A protein [Parasphingorhabdus sp.]|uniref:glycosyltransferase family 2 protein n=1 Tax=Parasphingorhabdus sp. TaxID=2709688 RepID=UPI0032EE1B2E